MGRREPGLESGLLAQGPLEHRSEGLNGAVHLEHLGLDQVAAAEREQLLGDGRRALGRTPHLIEIAADVGGDVGTAQDEVGEADHDGHLIVGLVRHAAGEPAEGLHPLDLTKVLLGTPLLGHVRRNPHDADRAPHLVRHHPSRHADPRRRTVVAQQTELHGVIATLGQSPLHGGAHATGVLRRQPGEQGIEGAREPVVRSGQHLGGIRGPDHAPGADVEVPGAHAPNREGETHALLGLTHRQFRDHACGFCPHVPAVGGIR